MTATRGGATRDNPLLGLGRLGQSVWYDGISRAQLASGAFARLVADGVTGVTSNPSIFEKAIGETSDYDAVLRERAAEGLDLRALLDSLIVEDIRAAADHLRPLYDRTAGADGFVSIEVDPDLAADTEGTVAEARRLWGLVARPNIMVKVPATPAGIPAVERLIAAGLNINITLMFSLDHYDRVAEAYIRGLERRAADGAHVGGVASVASFFVSRVDTLLDPVLREKGAPELCGRLAVANARSAYRRFRETFRGPRWDALATRGARPQRPLWASTSTKNPAYSDVLYAQELIAPDTVDTMPPATLEAFRDHGRAQATLEAGMEGSLRDLERAHGLGVDLLAAGEQLQEEGVRAFANDWHKLLQAVEAKRAAAAATGHGGAGGPRGGSGTPAGAGDKVGAQGGAGASLGTVEPAVDEALSTVTRTQAPARLWSADATLWRDGAAPASGPGTALPVGWLRAPADMRAQVATLRSFAAELRRDGFTDAVVLGMGGSSLCPDVLRRVFPPGPGGLRLHVLDTVDPVTVLRLERALDLGHALFLVSSKSGTTAEPGALFAHFWERRPDGAHFAAITDPGTPLESLAGRHGFRRVFSGWPDVGGRYSALTPFGLVPAALLGVDLDGLLQRAGRMAEACQASAPTVGNPGAWLGAILGGAFAAGRDKVTLLAPPALAPLGDWLEQLLAESTGKSGRGLVPVTGEPAGDPGVYGTDRLFCAFTLNGEAPAGTEALEAAGHPVVRLPLADPLDLGAEFFRWEVATAVAGSLMGIDAFDQPDVEDSKERTRRILAAWGQGRGAPGSEASGADAEDALPGFIAGAGGGDYVALQAYLPYDNRIEAALQRLRLRIRDGRRVATTVGYGPRFLHSTGQLHKGGGPNGLFLQLTADDAEDAPVPGQPYTLGLLKRAEAAGDLEALRARGRRTLHLHLGSDAAAALERLADRL